jgi:hypothetical protein
LILGFRRDVDEICALLGYYAASCGVFSRTLSLSVLFYHCSSLSERQAGELGITQTKEYTVGHWRALDRKILLDGFYFSLQMVTVYEILDDGEM